MKRAFFVRVACLAVISACVPAAGLAQNSPSALTSPAILSRTSESTVFILTGQGAGRLNGIASGVIVSSDGVILTAYHTIKSARELQIRLKSGDIYDRVELLDFDERRDVAAIKITGHSLPVLPFGDSSKITLGEPAYTVTSSNGLSWSAAEGTFSGMRAADEITGAGSGYRLLQFTAPIAPGASGGPVVNGQGELVGIITKGIPRGPSFAVPIENVMGLAEGTLHRALGSGELLQIPKQDSTPSSAALAKANPKEILQSAKTALVRSRTVFFTPDSLDRSLSQEKDFSSLGILLIKDPKLADLIIEIDRPLFTYQFTFSLLDPKTSIVLASGKVTAINGETASGMISKEVSKILAKSRQSTQTETKTQKG